MNISGEFYFSIMPPNCKDRINLTRLMKGLSSGVALLLAPLVGLSVVNGFIHPPANSPSSASHLQVAARYNDYDSAHPRQWYAPIEISSFGFGKAVASTLLVMSLALAVMAPLPALAASDDGGASVGANTKITTGGASTLQSGRTIAITRGVNLDGSDFSNKNLKGVAFQQSIVRDANFENCNLVGASFFDATVDGSNFQNADLTQANFEMAQLNRASLKVRYLDQLRFCLQFLSANDFEPIDLLQ
jgi:Pentapeptide repeats (9 copies)